MPMRVIEDTGERIVSVVWPGVVCLGPESWVAATRNPVERGRLIDELTSGTWALVEFAWMATTRLVIHEYGRFDSTFVCFDEHGTFTGWYVNFELPFVRTPLGFDTRDLALDLVVAPDGTWAWKDEEEFAHMRRVGAMSAQIC